jgi:hypothetical protein
MLDKNRDQVKIHFPQFGFLGFHLLLASQVPGEMMSLLSKSKSHFIKLLLGKDALIFNATHTMNGRRHTVLAKFKVKIYGDINWVKKLNPITATIFFCRIRWTI